MYFNSLIPVFNIKQKVCLNSRIGHHNLYFSCQFYPTNEFFFINIMVIKL